MKLTPEQKAFFEYGKARGILAGVRKEFVVSDVVFGISKQESITSFRKNHPLRHRLVKDAWQKRAACREWGHPMRRRCSNCEHDPKQYKCCVGCAAMGWPVYWKPRKEEK